MNTPMPADHPETRVVEVIQADDELIYQALRFYFWAAGQGISPMAGEDALEPEEGFWQYGLRSGDEEWETVAQRFRDGGTDRLRSTDQQGMVRGARRASAIDANDVLQRQRRHKGAFHRDDIIAAMQIYAEQYARAALTGSEAR